jgi:hypothetical protein
MKKILPKFGLALLFSVFLISPTLAINLNPSKSDAPIAGKDTIATPGKKEKIDEAFEDFKNLSKHEKKERIKDAKNN